MAASALEKGAVRFVCQRCKQPLKIDLSFETIDQQTELVKELTAPLLAHGDVDHGNLFPEKEEYYEEDTNISRRIIPPRYPDEDSNDFTLLGETEPSSMGTLGHKPKVQAMLFDIMSGQSTVDHPLCEECTDTLLNQLDEQLKVTEEECRDYRNFLDRLDTVHGEQDEQALLDDELARLRMEEKVLREQLQQVEEEKTKVEEDIKKERETTKKLEEEEDRYWREYNEYKRQVQELDDEQKSVDNQLKYAQAQLDKLKKTNVFNATFHIWHSGHFGTINNFRLGRLKSVPVEWSEINAAWGQTVLLLHSLALKMNLTFERYRLVPYGSRSYLESLTDKSKELPLYCSGGFRFFWDAKFDQAMVAFLDCVQQFKEAVERGDSQFCLPYRMEKDKIEDTSNGQAFSVKIQFNSEEKWTKALKFMLTNLKWGLAWVASQFANK
ncbi:beclin-1-like [Mya arenaria]|uniref:beclin-1-like n=1 Tax=Mya arenaria TaxID=6604 RepID=UPI0022E0ED2A|nr:beclin-1-like [Mya arenaria]